MADDDHGPARPGAPPERLADRAGLFRVQIARGLVREQEGGVVEHGAAVRDPLLFAARELRRVGVPAVGPPPPPRGAEGPPPPRPPIPPRGGPPGGHGGAGRLPPGAAGGDETRPPAHDA